MTRIQPTAGQKRRPRSLRSLEERSSHPDAALGARQRPTAGRWDRLAYDDAAGIDRDIEAVLSALQKKMGGSRDRASVELVRMLSFAA